MNSVRERDPHSAEAGKLESFRIFQTLYQQRATLALLNTEHDDAAIAIGESGICLPKVIGQTVLCDFTSSRFPSR
ncbi:MAG: hypothetical protein NC421_11840 [Lachnospiraceae bacterium]|nr:hypothetical protein [Lachnospiraceae bacterium]